MIKEFTRYIIEGKIKQEKDDIGTWTHYGYREWEDIQDAIDEVQFYRTYHKQHEWRVVKRDYVATDTILQDYYE